MVNAHTWWFYPAWQLVFYNVIATVVLVLSIALVIRGLLSMKRDEGAYVDLKGYLLIMLTAPPLIFLIQTFCIPVPSRFIPHHEVGGEHGGLFSNRGSP